VIGVWAAEIETWFSKSFRLLISHGSKAEVKNPLRRDKVVSGGRDGLIKALDRLDERDGSTVNTIVLSSYTTHAVRFLHWLDEDGKIHYPSRGGARNAAIRPVDLDADNDDEMDIGDDEGGRVIPGAETKEFRSLLHNRFGRVICDEAHIIKNPNTDNHIAVKTLGAVVKFFLSATPASNSLVDFLGYLSLLFRREWRLDPTPALPMEIFDESKKTYAVFAAQTEGEGNQKKRKAQTMEVKKPDGWLHLLDPQIYLSMLCGGNMAPDVAKLVLGAILGKIQLRRTMATKMDLE
jgi:SNF2 family DNA or RNA helicase